MWEILALAGAGGGLTALLVWQMLHQAWERSEAYGLQGKVKQRIAGEAVKPSEDFVVPLRDARYSQLPVLDRLIRRIAVTSRISTFLQQAGSSLNVSSFVLIHLVCFSLAILIASWLHVPALIKIPLAVVISLAPLAVIASQRRKRLNRLTEQLPDAIRLVSSSLRAGLGLDVGLQGVASELQDPICGEFRQLVNESLMEFNMNDAFRRFAKRIPLEDYQLFAAAACLHREVGGNFAELLDQLEQTVRERFRIYRELKTATALGRFEGLFLAVLPVLLSILLIILNPNYFRTFIDHPMGRVVLWTVVGLELIGFAIIHWLTHPRIQ